MKPARTARDQRTPSSSVGSISAVVVTLDNLIKKRLVVLFTLQLFLV